MLVATKAIVISKIRFKDNDLIVKCYTEASGIKSYLIKNALKRKSGKFKAAYFQLLTLLEIQADHKASRSLQYLREVKLVHNYRTVHSNVKKGAIAMFLAEILDIVIREEEEHPALYQFMETAFIWFDEQETNTSFHLVFLIELTKYLGFYPDLSQIDASVFNLEEGKFESQPTSNYCVSGTILTHFKSLLGIKFDVHNSFKMSSVEKRELLDIMLLYFKLHLHGFKTPKSVSVLNQVFA